MYKNDWDKIYRDELDTIKSLSTDELMVRIKLLEKLAKEIRMRLDTLT